MTSPIQWCGIDFSFTIVNPLAIHNSVIITETYQQLGREHEAQERVQRWYKLRDGIGSLNDAAHQRVRLLKEYSRDRIYKEVFDGDEEVVRLYEAKEKRAILLADGFDSALNYLRRKSTPMAIVSEASSISGVFTVIRVLKNHSLEHYFEEVITPAGRFGLDEKILDRSFEGANKKTGSIYQKLSYYLGTKGIMTENAAIIGDDPVFDINHAKEKGFKTIQYCGIIDRGRTNRADHVLNHWSEISHIL